MIKYIAHSFVIMTCVMHLFCCGIPLLLSVTSLAATFGISSGSLLEFEWFEAIERELFILSGAVLCITILVHITSRRLKATESVGNCDTACASKNSTSHYLLIGATFLYAINLMTFLIE